MNIIRACIVLFLKRTLPTITTRYHFTENDKIGEGTYGVVYRAFDTQTGATVAIKKLKDQPGHEGRGLPPTVFREIAVCLLLTLCSIASKLLRELVHENVVRLSDVIADPTERVVYLVFEFAQIDLFVCTPVGDT